MDNSEAQFQELIANLVARVNKMLGTQNKMLPIGLLLLRDHSVDVNVAIEDDELPLNEALNHLQKALIEKATAVSATAACLAYPDYENEQVIAYLENNENYAARCLIPVSDNPSLQLDASNMKVEDGQVFVFGRSHG